ncbi:unnamed protein product, partial [marine sediment metagenome]
MRTSFHIPPAEEEVQFRTQKRRSVPKVKVAATTWFSVREEKKIPAAIKADPMRNKPRYPFSMG